MSLRLKTCLWRAALTAVFQCARILAVLIKPRVRGALVAVWHGNRILLIEKSYQKKWSVPGGLVNRGESWTQAAVRETVEEVGIHISESDLILVGEVNGDLGPRDRAQFFETWIDGPVHVTVDGREIIHAEFVEPAEALQRNLNEPLKVYLKGKLTQISRPL
jgi:8-oxo-dGTP diphosphatase